MPIRARSRGTVLLVEDNRGDVDLMRYCLKKEGFPVDLHVARDGMEALVFLDRAMSGAAAVPPPSLVLLDLNLPRKDGREVLREIRSNRQASGIPVVVFTSSWDPDDVRTVYESGANAYVSKPVDLEDYLALIDSILSFWLETAQLPSV